MEAAKLGDILERASQHTVTRGRYQGLTLGHVVGLGEAEVGRASRGGRVDAADPAQRMERAFFKTMREMMVLEREVGPAGMNLPPPRRQPNLAAFRQPLNQGVLDVASSPDRDSGDHPGGASSEAPRPKNRPVVRETLAIVPHEGQADEAAAAQTWYQQVRTWLIWMAASWWRSLMLALVLLMPKLFIRIGVAAVRRGTAGVSSAVAEAAEQAISEAADAIESVASEVLDVNLTEPHDQRGSAVVVPRWMMLVGGFLLARWQN